MDAREIQITKSAAKTREGQIKKATKNRSSYRSITIPPELIPEIKEYKQTQLTRRIKSGKPWTGNAVFTQHNGERMDLDTPTKAFRKFLRKYNKSVSPELQLPEITLHGLRHTSATLLIAGHADIRTVSARLGHAQTSTTLNIYSGAFRSLSEFAIYRNTKTLFFT